MSEASFQGAVEEYAAILRWLVYHTRDIRGSRLGFPDLVLRQPGGETHVWRPGAWNEIIEVLTRRDRPRRSSDAVRAAAIAEVLDFMPHPDQLGDQREAEAIVDRVLAVINQKPPRRFAIERLQIGDWPDTNGEAA